MSQWHCKIGDHRYGPITSHELKCLAADGKLRPTDLVKRDGDTAWARASAVRGLFAAGAQVSASTPPVASLFADSPANGSPGSPPSASARTEERAIPNPGVAWRKFSPRDILGFAAIGLSVILILGAIGFALRRRPRGAAEDGRISAAEALALSHASDSSAVGPSDAIGSTVDAQTAGSEELQGSSRENMAIEPRVVQANALPSVAPSAMSDARVPKQDAGATSADLLGMNPGTPPGAQEIVADPTPAPISMPIPATPAELPAQALAVAPVDVTQEPIAPIQAADFRVPVADGSGPFALSPPQVVPADELPVGREPSTDASAPPDPRDDVYRQELRQLFEQTRKALRASEAAQNEVVKVNNEIRQAQTSINAADVQIPLLTQQLANIAFQLGGRLTPESRATLKSQGTLLQAQLAMLVQAKQNSEKQLELVLPRKLREVEGQAAAAAEKCDALLPDWIVFGDPFGDQSRVAHVRMAESCSEWLAGDPGFIPAFLMRGFARWHAGESDAALQDFDQVVARAGERTKTKNEQGLLAAGLAGRSVLYAERKQEAQAKADFGKAVELCPKSALVCILRGRANAALGKTRSAQDDFLRATKLDAREPAGFRELAWLLATSPTVREGKRAADFGHTACELTKWSQWQCLDSYALANAADGNFDQALEVGRKAHESAPHDARPEMEQRLKLYQAGVVPTNVRRR